MAARKPGAPSEPDMAALRKEVKRWKLKPGRWFARLLLVAGLASLCLYDAQIRHWLAVSESVTWQYHSREAFLTSLRTSAWHAAGHALPFFLLGLLLPFAIGKTSTDRLTYKRGLLTILFAVGLTTVVCGIRKEAFPDLWDVTIPVIGCLVGLRIGSAAIQGKKALLWLIPQTCAHLLLFGIGLLTLVYFAADVEPLIEEETQYSQAEKRLVAKRIRQTIQQQHGSQRQLRLSEEDVNILATWGLETAAVDAKLWLGLEEETLDIHASREVPIPRIGSRYFNLHAKLRMQIDAGQASFQLQQLQVGRLALPAFACNSLGNAIFNLLMTNEDVQQTVASIESLKIETESVELIGNKEAVQDHLLASLTEQFGVQGDLVAATAEHINHLLLHAGDLPQGDERFVGVLQHSFSFAQERSLEHDPVLENRAALLSLGILMGHHRVGKFVGSPELPQMLADARRQLGSVTIRGRRDWTKHFSVSAALVVLADATTSDVFGVLKEELDSEGGSGFSFGDLAADRAGTLFAEAATRDERSARFMQRRLSAGPRIGQVFPPAADLPEGLSAEELQVRYGGIGGPGYRQLEQEIEQRLQQCELLR